MGREGGLKVVQAIKTLTESTPVQGSSWYMYRAFTNIPSLMSAYTCLHTSQGDEGIH